jgi:hypothetical protein
MNRQLAKELKAAGFPIHAYQAGHKFYPNENSTAWSEAAREHGVTVTAYELQNHLQDIKDGYYCPSLSDLTEACGESFARLSIEKTIWTAEGRNREQYALAYTPEEAVARLWFALHQGKP